jgi:UDP-N-acetylglucosamine 2-epimerase (non-hydrolysing)
MKILTILGTRPEIIRLSRVIPRLDEALGRENHFVANTNQNFDADLNENFFKEFGLRGPDYCMGMAMGCGTGKPAVTFAEQLAVMFPRIENVISSFKPDRVLVLGDTNSSLAAIVAARLLIPVYHMEAGNRSYSARSPEEVNRRLIDHCSTILLPYTERSRANLLAEGIHSSRIFVTGNPIKEVIDYYADRIDASDIFNELEIDRHGYFLVTLHRAENIDDLERLTQFLSAFDQLSHRSGLPIIVSTHPHLRARIDALSYPVMNTAIRFLPPFGFFDFIALARAARSVLSDSGTVQEECAILGTPMVCLRDQTERPECIEAGASVLSGADPARIVQLVRQVTRAENDPGRTGHARWTAPAEYLRTNVAETVVGILLGHREGSQL